MLMLSRKPSAFTLIELLVVISIIGVLVAILLPAIGKARMQARLLQHSTNIRGMVQGYMTYAADQRGKLAQVVYSLGTDPIWFKIPGMFDHTSIFIDYGTMPLTKSPLLGNTVLNDPSVTFSEGALPWYYFPGQVLPSYSCFVPGYETTNSLAPTLLEKGQSNHVMLQDTLVGTGGTNYIGSLSAELNMMDNSQLYITTMPSYRYVPFSSLEQVLGCYTGNYDGSVALRKMSDARWSGYYYANLTTYKWAHFQP